MENENYMNERILKVCESLGISKRQFGISIGRSGGWVGSLATKKGQSISLDDLQKILLTYPAVNKDYILSGNGDPLLENVDTLSDFPDSYMPEADNYKELCMAYRQDLADARDEIKRLREAYFQLLEKSNNLMESYSTLQAACLKTGINPMERDILETKKA